MAWQRQYALGDLVALGWESGDDGLVAEALTAGLPKRWRWLFMAELPLVAGTVAFALAAPERFAREAFGIEAFEPAVHTLLLSYTSVVATAVGLFYARLLLARSVHLPTFRHYQEALLLGDVGIVALWSWALATRAVSGPAPITGMTLALAWGAVRVVFLARVRVPSPEI